MCDLSVLVLSVWPSHRLSLLASCIVCFTWFNILAGDMFRAIQLAGGHVICTNLALDLIGFMLILYWNALFDHLRYLYCDCICSLLHCRDFALPGNYRKLIVKPGDVNWWGWCCVCVCVCACVCVCVCVCEGDVACMHTCLCVYVAWSTIIHWCQCSIPSIGVTLE